MFHNLIIDSGILDSPYLFLQISDKKLEREEKTHFD